MNDDWMKTLGKIHSDNFIHAGIRHCFNENKNCRFPKNLLVIKVQTVTTRLQIYSINRKVYVYYQSLTNNSIVFFVVVVVIITWVFNIHFLPRYVIIKFFILFLLTIYLISVWSYLFISSFPSYLFNAIDFHLLASSYSSSSSFHNSRDSLIHVPVSSFPLNARAH